jgi:uncharacterized protein with PIN domain
MAMVVIRLHGELPRVVPARKRREVTSYPFNGRPSLKHLVESLGIPHTEVGEIRVNGQPAGLDDLTLDGSDIDIFPVTPKRPTAGETRFIADTHLGKLAAYLRMLGFDTLYRNDYYDEELAALSAGQERILLTRDRGLLKRKQVTLGFCVVNSDPRQQVADVLDRFALHAVLRPFTRCVHCNTLLQDVAKQEISERIPAGTRACYDEFRVCTACGQIYWKGSHTVWMQAFIDRLVEGDKS